MSRTLAFACLIALFFATSSEGADWNGLPAEILETGHLRVVVLPQQGASVVSFYDLRHDKEWLWELPSKRISWAKKMPSAYELSGGIEDAFPTLGEVAAQGSNAGLPFFGNVWNKSWRIEQSSATSVTCSYRSSAPSYLLIKRFIVEPDRLTISYEWKNLSADPEKALWVSHGLFQIDEKTRIDLSKGTAMRVHSWIKDGKERFGGNFSWPLFDLENPPRDLRFVSTNTVGRSDKFYVTQWKQRQLILGAENGSSLTLTFGDTIRSLGLWINQKAFPFAGPKYSIIGLEPATSPYENLAEATQHQDVMQAHSGETIRWSYSIRLN
jgi:galactose mutarotase-like enzyme